MKRQAEGPGQGPQESFSEWDALAGKRILFGHQSVGFNIMEGVARLVEEQHPANMSVIEERKIPSGPAGVFAHFKVGSNKDPYSKCDDFKAAVDENAGEVDIAFFKFCYVDVVADTNIEDVFSYYEKTISGLKQRYPHIRFVTCTVPLRTASSGSKARVKRVLGMWVWGDDDNINRNAYNQLLRKAYPADELFDIARVESARDGAAPATFVKAGVRYPVLDPVLSSDGGHLNAAGSRLVAVRLLRFLASQQ